MLTKRLNVGNTSGKIKKIKNNKEMKFVEEAEFFFKKAMNRQNKEKAAEFFGKGLAYLLFIYKSRRWYSRYNPFKSFFTGVRPVGRKIEAFMKVDLNDSTKSSDKFRNMLETLYLTVFRNHKIKAFKSVLETSNLKKILLGIDETKKEMEVAIENKLKELENKIKYDEFEIETFKEDYISAAKDAILGAKLLSYSGLILPFFAGIALIGYAALSASLTGILHSIWIVFNKLTGITRRDSTLDFLWNQQMEFEKKISCTSKQFMNQIRCGISEQLKKIKSNPG